MVVFTCNACNESIKKNQVEKHFKFQCKRCEYVSCVDCNQEFWGDDYSKHTKCITEDAKYGGKDYKPKANANKGEKKQEAWIEQVQAAIDKCQSNTKLRGLLEKLKDYSNIPRKKAKFENFIKNSLRIQPFMATQMWDAISVEIQAPTPQVNGTTNGADKLTNDTENGRKNSASSETGTEQEEQKEDKKKLSKREKKEERRKATHKEEKKNKGKKQETQGVTESKKVEKKRKRKHEEETEESPEEKEEEQEEEEAPATNKKKKKGKKAESEEVCPPASKKKKKSQNEDSNECEEGNDESEKESKFSWEKVIVAVLKKADDNQMSIKKLKKKVLAEYAAYHSDSPYTQDRILAKFNKKINKNPVLKVHKETVTLKS